MSVFYMLLLPLLGTTLGTACVFFLKGKMNSLLQKFLLGFASGVMVAASVWSLIVPSIELSEEMQKFAFVPAAIGVALGFAFLLALDELTPHLHANATVPEGLTANSANLRKTTMMFFAVTLHNVPEGMSVGIVAAGVLSGSTNMSLAGAFALAIGIAIQNFPEGAIVSLPLVAEGKSKPKSFLFGFFSGVVEPVAALVTIMLSKLLVPVMPYCLSFAAGAMLYVVVEELIPEASEGNHSNLGTIGFALGFVLMMILDVALG